MEGLGCRAEPALRINRTIRIRSRHGDPLDFQRSELTGKSRGWLTPFLFSRRNWIGRIIYLRLSLLPFL